jgi:pyruvate/2-oxoglutarate dehydrogenase complex dihydrolipoamide acyltransferase (E2) component
MVVEIKVPTIADAGGRLSIGRWFKRVGDPVSIGEPLVEIDTFDLTHEIQAPATGILSKVLVNDGGFVELGTVIGTIDQVCPAKSLRPGPFGPQRRLSDYPPLERRCAFPFKKPAGENRRLGAGVPGDR